MLMVKAGPAVDEFIEQLLPCLEAGDIIIDGGNSNYQRHHAPHRARRVQGAPLHRHRRLRAARRARATARRSCPAARPRLAARQADLPGDRGQGRGRQPCCDWVGENGAGHFVKMVHNGIEYGDMQLICEAYQLMKDGLGMTTTEMHGSSPSGTRASWTPT
jgi:6-phosphogluconate dehydrogenase